MWVKKQVEGTHLVRSRGSRGLGRAREGVLGERGGRGGDGRGGSNEALRQRTSAAKWSRGLTWWGLGGRGGFGGLGRALGAGLGGGGAGRRRTLAVERGPASANVGRKVVEGTHLVGARGSRGLGRAWEGLGGDSESRGCRGRGQDLF